MQLFGLSFPFLKFDSRTDCASDSAIHLIVQSMPIRDFISTGRFGVKSHFKSPSFAQIFL